MKFEHRPYSSRSFRPLPEVHFDSEARLLLVATPWGNREAARKVIDRMLEYFTLALEDSEATSPFERLSCLSDTANTLRIATFLANEALYREDNRNEYSAGVELFAASFVDRELVWVQIGHPHILLSRRGRDLLPLGSTVDLSLDLSTKEKALPPLPNQLLGLDSTANLTISSIRAQPGDRIVLASHSALPKALYNLEQDEIDIERISLLLAKHDPESAFWLGVLSFDDEISE